MKFNISLLLLFFLIACNNKNNKAPINIVDTLIKDSTALIKNLQQKINISTIDFSEIDSSGVLVYPLTLHDNEINKEGFSSSYKSSSPDNYWNMIFYNTLTNNYHLLTNDKILFLSKYDNPSASRTEIENSSSVVIENEKYSVFKNYLFYKVVNTDFNNDKLLNTEDPTYLYISDKFGNNFHRISPLNCDFIGWNYLDTSHKFLLKIKKDINNNKKFTDEVDELTTYEVDIEKETEPKEIFNIDFKNKMKILFDKHWQKSNK